MFRKGLYELSAHDDGNIFVYKEIDEATGELSGRSVSFSGVEILPLGYADLVGMKSGDLVTAPICLNRSLVTDSSIPEIDSGRRFTVNFRMESIYSSKTIALIPGGWLPAGLALRKDVVVLPDRCTITELSRRFVGGKYVGKSGKDFIDFALSPKIRMNPMLFALEGNVRSNPSVEVVMQQLDEARKKVSEALPHAELVPARDDGVNGVIGILAETASSMHRKQEFLMRLAPKLGSPVSQKHVAPLWEDVCVTADACGVSKRSLVVLAVLSAISVQNGKSPVWCKRFS